MGEDEGTASGEAKQERAPAEHHTRSRSGLTLALMVVAVLGWGAALWLFLSASSLQNDLTRQVEAAESARAEAEGARDEVAASLAALEEASGTLADIETQVGAEQDALASIQSDREGAQVAHDADLARLTEEIAAGRRMFELQVAEVGDIAAAARGQARGAETRLADLTNQVDGRQAELDRLRGRLLDVSERLMVEQAAVGLSVARAATETQKLAAIGDRVASARDREAEARSSLSALASESDTLAQELAAAERRIQTAREAEASRQQQLMTSQSELGRLRIDRDDLTSAIEDLRQRRQELSDDVEGAEEQRARLQQQVTELSATLADRSGQLQELEARIAEMQQRGSDIAESADVSGNASDTGSADSDAEPAQASE